MVPLCTMDYYAALTMMTEFVFTVMEKSRILMNGYKKILFS